MHIPEVIKHVPDTHVLRVFAYLVFIGSHSVTSYQSLALTSTWDRHITLWLRSLCRSNWYVTIISFLTIYVKKKGAVFSLPPKGWGLHTED